jgi:predicted permease
MSMLAQDVKRSLRQLRRQPLFTLTAVLTLAVGIGVNAVAFTVINGVLFKNAGWHGDDVGRVATTPGGDEGGYASLEEYRRISDATRGALDLTAEGRQSVAWRHDGTTETAWVLFVASNYFSMVDAPVVAGRIEVSPGVGGAPSVVIGERFWRRKLNAASISGLTLRLNNADVSVAGVIADSFTGPSGIYSPDVWLPLDELTLFRTSPALQKRDHRWLFLMGRLKPGLGVPEIQGRLDTAAAGMAHDWPESHRKRGARFRLFKDGNSERRAIAAAGGVAMGIVGLVLLLACFNVANLLLARAVERERDMGIRSALGASAPRLIRLVAIEGFLIATMAGAGAVVLAWWTHSLVGSFAIPIEQPQHIDLTPDATVVGFIALLVLVAGVLPGLWPASAAARVDVLRVLGSQGASTPGGRPSPIRRWLVGAQIVGSTAFLAIAALFVQSYGKVSIADLGLAQDRILVAEVEPAAHGYDRAASERYMQALLMRLRALPGVSDVAMGDHAPFFIGFDRMTPASSSAKPCEPDSCAQFATMAVGPAYFRTLGIALAEGREFTAFAVPPPLRREGRGTPTEVIVNQPLARQFWPEGRGVGETLRIGQDAILVTVIGITARTHTRGLNREQPTLYVPVGPEQFEGSMTVAVRTALPPAALVRPFIEASQAVDSDVSLTSLRTMQQRVDVQLWPFRTISWLFSVCGVLALILATVGLAGVVVHAVNRRLREFGVRVSLGATRRHIVVDVLKSSAGLLIPGLVIGLALAAVAARLVKAVFLGIDVLNPSIYIAVALVEAAIVLVACISPALRASRVDPLAALRSE